MALSKVSQHGHIHSNCRIVRVDADSRKLLSIFNSHDCQVPSSLILQNARNADDSVIIGLVTFFYISLIFGFTALQVVGFLA